LHKQIIDGLNPIEERRAKKTRLALDAAKTKTFAQCAAEYIADNRAGWKKKTASRWDSTLTNYVLPKIGKLSIRDKVREAYLRGTLFEDRKRLMEDWARECGTIPAAPAAKGDNEASIRKAV